VRYVLWRRRTRRCFDERRVRCFGRVTSRLFVVSSSEENYTGEEKKTNEDAGYDTADYGFG
jgi:hypothetical protein